MEPIPGNLGEAIADFKEVYQTEDTSLFLDYLCTLGKFEDKTHFVRWNAVWLGMLDDYTDYLDDFTNDNDAVIFYFKTENYKFSKNGYVFNEDN